MNPFDLRGTEFLVFYLICGATTIVTVWLVRRFWESGPAPRFNTVDPYLVATLRGGPAEALGTCIVSLIDRGLLMVESEKNVRAQRPAAKSGGQPLEEAVIDYFQRAWPAQDALRSAGLKQQCAPMEKELQQAGLLPDGTAKAQRWWIALAAFAVLGFFAGTKLLVALSRGRRNIGFLIVLWIVLTIVAAVVAHPRRTAKGDAVLSDIQNLFSGLKERASGLVPGQSHADLALLAGTFGVMSLPDQAFPYRKTLFPRAAAAGSGNSCGSSCGSSCGGGCGGGCGGCGS